MLAEIKTLSDRKEEVLAEARRLFSEKGYASASMRDLADALGIKPASLYSNFASKEDMLWEIALRCARAFFEKIEPITQEATAPEQKLRKMLSAHLEVIIQNKDASTIFFEQWKYLGPERKKQYATYMHNYEQKFVAVIKEGITKGTFRPLTPGFVTLTLLSASNWISRWYRTEGSMSLEEVKRELLIILMGGVGESVEV